MDVFKLRTQKAEGKPSGKFCKGHKVSNCFGVLLALTAAIGLFAAVTGALSRWVEGSKSRRALRRSPHHPRGSSSQPEGMSDHSFRGMGRDPIGDRTEGGSPSEETPSTSTAPPRCGQCTSPPGDFLSDGDLSADKVVQGTSTKRCKTPGSVDELGDCQPHHWGEGHLFWHHSPAGWKRILTSWITC